MRATPEADPAPDASSRTPQHDMSKCQNTCDLRLAARSRQKRLTPPKRFDVFGPLQQTNRLIRPAPFPRIVLPGQCRRHTFDLTDEDMLHNLLWLRPISLPPLVLNRKAIRKIYRFKPGRAEAGLFKYLPSGPLDEGFAGFRSSCYSLPECSESWDSVQE